MNEIKLMDNLKNLPAAKNELEAKEMHNGYPVLSAEEYERYYKTDAAALEKSAEGSVTTFDFQGYVKDKEGGLIYKDAMATNGLLKAEGHKGIHVGTDGIPGYHAKNIHNMQNPDDVGEYDIRILIPPQLQKEKGVICQYDSCKSVKEFKEHYDADDEEVSKTQDIGNYIVIRTMLEPKEDKNARKQMQAIHQAIIQHIIRDKPLDEIEDKAIDIERRLEDGEESDIQESTPRLRLGPKE